MTEWFQQRASHRSHEQGPFRPAGTRSDVLYGFCVLLEHALEDSMSIPSHFSRSLEVLQVVLHAHTIYIMHYGSLGPKSATRPSEKSTALLELSTCFYRVGSLQMTDIKPARWP